MLKVMLVDDEIMAMDHIRMLVDWESFGFEVTAMETKAMKGLAVLDKEEIDVIFVDVRMPGMDGLEFSRKALEIKPNLEIIILTSYGDFDYAKKALNLGASNYLLKHETNAKNLSEELERIRKKLLDYKQNNKVILSQLLLKFISYPDVLSEEEINRMKYLLSVEKKNMISYLVVLDVPLPLFEKENSYTNPDIHKDTLESYVEPKYNNMITIPLKSGQWLILNVFEPLVSQRQILDETYMDAYGLQRYVVQNYNRTVSIIPSQVFNNIDELPMIYKELRKVSGYLIFFDKNKILYGRDLYIKNEIGREKIEDILKDIYTELMKENLKGILRKIDMFFVICERNLDEKAFRYFVSNLGNMYMRYIHDNQIEYILQNKEEILKDTYCVSQAHERIALLFETALLAVKEKEFQKYSPKIQSAMKYILDNYQKDLKIDEVGSVVNVSGEYLRHIFKEEVGKGFSEYLTEVRIEKAKKLLAENKYKLYEIADLVGYSSGTYFSTVFKKVTGMNPQDYAGDING